MKKRVMIRALALMLAVGQLLCLCGCGSSGSSHSRPELSLDVTEAQQEFAFSAQPSQMLNFSEEAAAAVLAVVSRQQADYAYADLYELEEVKARLDFSADVAEHRYCVLNETGELDAAYMAKLVEANNEAYLLEHDFGYEAVESDYLLELCTLILQTVEQMRSKYPDIDWQRVYCNLGNLKILYDVGMLSYAQVSKELVLSISKTNTEIVLRMEDENGLRNVLVHETMHILQIGCVCEDIEHCERRCGISTYWDDFDLNTTDWVWLAEGSAERNMCTLTGADAISYQYKMDYICSFTMSLLLRDSVKADTMETLSFYSDPDLLFDAFGCQSQEERDEVLKLMITMNVLQMQPEEFYEAYKAATGIDPQESEESLNQFSYCLKPAICVTLAKEFYENLTAFLGENQVSVNDLFFLMTLFEGHLNQHLTYNSESKAQINQPFFDCYRAMREALFTAIEAENPELDMHALYAAYDITAGEGLLNAELAMLPEEKRAFLAERAQWQDELLALGVTVPEGA